VLPWDVLLLFGGGLSLRPAMDSSGLTDLARQVILTGLKGLPLPLSSSGIATLVCALGEFASNLAIATSDDAARGVARRRGGSAPGGAACWWPASASSLGFAPAGRDAAERDRVRQRRDPMRQMVKAGLLIDVVGIIVVAVLLAILAPSGHCEWSRDSGPGPLSYFSITR
jgi:sodium-dependent dicarboxylate transporter 2/3/5